MIIQLFDLRSYFKKILLKLIFVLQDSLKAIVLHACVLDRALLVSSRDKIRLGGIVIQLSF